MIKFYECSYLNLDPPIKISSTWDKIINIRYKKQFSYFESKVIANRENFEFLIMNKKYQVKNYNKNETAINKRANALSVMMSKLKKEDANIHKRIISQKNIIEAEASIAAKKKLHMDLDNLKSTKKPEEQEKVNCDTLSQC